MDSSFNLTNHQIKKLLIKTDSLIEHYSICYNILNSPTIDIDTLAWVFVYLRLFSIKDIKLHMRHNYQTKDIAHLQNILSMASATAYTNTYINEERDQSLKRICIRNILNFVPRGGGNGDELRLFILDVMRRHGIREGHRPGIDDPFLEQWHQKLHSNCTPEDITICEAYICYQETNSLDLFYKTLWERGEISVDFLRNMPRPLTDPPRYMPQLLPDLKHLLWILKQIHGGLNNFHYLLEMSRWQLDQNLFFMLEEIKNNFGAWWVPGKIIDCRLQLKNYLNGHCPRDPLMIDAALDNMFKTSIEKIKLCTLSEDDIIALIFLSLQNIQLSYDDKKIGLCVDLWKRIKDVPAWDKWSHEWALQVFAALTNIQSIINSHMDHLFRLIQPRAQILGESCTIDKSYQINFAEEVIRSQNTFSLAKLIDTLSPIIRKIGNISHWKLISHGSRSATGTIKPIDSLLSMQGEKLEKPHIMLVNTIQGIEDIPDNVAALLTRDDVDILSHISIRCRNLNIILATCYDPDQFEKIKSYEGKVLCISIDNDIIHYNENMFLPNDIKAKNIKIPCSIKCGSKSSNLQNIKKKISDFIKIPPSVSIPPEVFQHTLHSNIDSSILYEKLLSKLSYDYIKDSSLLFDIKELIYKLIIPPDSAHFIKQKILQEGILDRWSQSIEDSIFLNIKKVWGSVWNERSYLSRLSRNIKSARIRMGVLIQNVIPADYSFIIHTHNPITNNNNEIITEIVVGLGETLASNSPGSPLCVISTKKEHTHTIVSYPSKNIAYFNPDKDTSLIIRSDSNDEDLSDFTGAGLYDSYFLHKPIHTFVEYDQEKLFWNKDFQHSIFTAIVRIAEEIEDIMESPQDIEGIYSNDSFYIVQTRNQII
ncbi:MAG: phosphohistidine-like domain-containing protein [bacterium]